MSSRSAETGLSASATETLHQEASHVTSLHVDWTRCDGRGLCAELLPELLGRDEWGYPLARDGTRDIAVPRALRRHAADAVSACPVLALRLRGTS
jgi:ferredoxin